MNEHIKKYSVNFGLISAAITIGYTLYAYSVDYSMFTNYVAGILLMFFTIGIMLVPVVKVKKAQGGLLSFKEGFSSYVLGWILSAVIGAVFNIILFTMVDPDAGVAVNELRVESQIKMMEGFGLPEADLQEQIEQLENTDMFAMKTQLQGVLGSIVFGAIIGLIVAAVFKKAEPMFAQSQNSETIDD